MTRWYTYGMHVEPYPPLSPHAFETFCREWVDVILRQESGTWLCPPLSAPYRTILQFFEDDSLQRKLFRQEYPQQILVHVDFKQQEDITKTEALNLIKDSLLLHETDIIDKTLPLYELLELLTTKQEKRVSFFVEGLDGSIRQHQWDIIEELSSLAQKSWNIHILLFLETDITHPEFFSAFSKRTTLAQNILYFHRYPPAEADYFKKYLSYNWNVQLTSDQEKWIEKFAGGHFLFIKEVFRQVAKNPTISFEELDNADIFRLKAEAVFSNFLSDEQSVLMTIANKQPIPSVLNHSKNHLLKLGWIKEKNNIFEITVPYVTRYILENKNPSEEKNMDPLLLYTRLERTVLDYLRSHANKLVTREAIAESMWGKDSEEKYSDWAIDQTLHKIREKIKESKASYEIQTKKGEGFILVDKS